MLRWPAPGFVTGRHARLTTWVISGRPDMPGLGVPISALFLAPNLVIALWIGRVFAGRRRNVGMKYSTDIDHAALSSTITVVVIDNYLIK